MAKAFSTYTVIRGKEPLLRQIVCEVRYQDGQLYLDRCGRLLKQLQKNAPEWVVAPAPTPQGTSVYNIRTGTQFGFSTTSGSLSLDKSTTDEVIDQSDADAFLEQVDLVLGLLTDELEVTSFTRLGYREYYYFTFGGKEEAEKWIQGLDLVAVSPGPYRAFAAAHEALGIALVLEGTECHYRIGLNGIERHAQVPVGETMLTVRPSAAPKDQKKVLMEALKKQRQRQINTAFAVVLDIDAYLLEPQDPDLHAFVREHAENNLKRFREALAERPSKKEK